MATLEQLIIENCPMPNIVCWARKKIIERLRELHHYIVSIRTMQPVAMKRLICDYLEDDLDAILEKICGLETEVCNDDIVTPELQCFIVEYLTDLTSNEPFDENTHRLGWGNHTHEVWRRP